MRLRIHIRHQAGVGAGHLQEVVGRAQSRPFDRPRNVEDGEAFRDDNRMKVNVATAQALLNFNDIGGLVEQILASLQAASVMVVVPEDEGALAADDSGFLQFGGNMAGGVSRTQ